MHIVKLMNKLPCYFYFKSVSHLINQPFNSISIDDPIPSASMESVDITYTPSLDTDWRTLNLCTSDHDSDALLGSTRYQPTFLTWTSLSRDDLNAREGLNSQLSCDCRIKVIMVAAYWDVKNRQLGRDI